LAEEQKQELSPDKQEQQVEQKPALTAIEQQAQTQGWVPKDEWDGDPEQWRPAKEFVDRGELFKKIDEQNRTIKEFKRTLDEFAVHHKKVRETEYKRALDDLKKAKKEALLEGDADAVVDLDDKIALVREAQTQPTPQQNIPQADPQNHVVFQAWVGRNSWYQSNPAMRAYADRVGNDLGAQGGMSPTDLLSHVEHEVKKQFAEKFNNPNRDKPGAVEGSTNKGSKGKDTFTLSEDERRAMQRFVKQGVISEADYISELKKTRGVL
jgi:DNA gyrase/topoisomerase IV subunit A